MQQQGYIVTWSVPPAVTLGQLREALRDAGIPEGVAGDLHPRYALTRALRELARECPRLVRKLPPDQDGRPRMQLTREFLRDAGLEYQREAILTLDGCQLSGDEPAIVAKAQAALDAHVGLRLTADLTRLVQRIVQAAGSDLMPIREQGGAYYIPEGHAVLPMLQKLLRGIGGGLRKFAVSVGHESSEAIAQTVADYLLRLVEEFQESVAELQDKQIRADVRAHRLATLAELRQKLDAYGAVLAGAAAHVATELQEAEATLLKFLTAA